MAKVLYTAHALVTGGRDGRGRTDDGELDVLPSVGDRETATGLRRGAHQVCPYSNATRGNIDVELRLDGEPL